MKFLSKIIFVNIVLTISILAQGFGSYGAMDAKNIGLGRTNAVSARGVYAIGVNPANLAIPQEHKYELSTVIPYPNINFVAGNDFITLNDYNDFFTGVDDGSGNIVGKFLDDSEKSKFMSLFDNGSMINTNFGLTILSLTFHPSKEMGAFGFSIQDWVSAEVTLPKQIFELVLYGNEIEKVFELNDMNVQSWYLRNYSLSYAQDLTKFFPDAFRFFSAGISVKLVHGFFYSGVDKMNTTLETTADHSIMVNGDSKMLVAASPSFGIEYDFENNDSTSTDATLEENESSASNVGFFNEPAGSGFGIDLGFYAELNKVWSIAFAVTDLGSITWDNQPVEYFSSGSVLLEDITDENMLDSLGEAITGEGRYTDPFTTSLATAMKMGVGFKLDEFLKGSFPGTMLIELNYHQGFNDMPLNSLRERFSLGIDWMPADWFSLRTGASVGNYDGFNWALGLGFDAGLLDFDIATSYFNSIVNGNNAKRLGIALSSRWTF